MYELLEYAVSRIVAGIHAEGGPPDRAAHLLLRATQELEQGRQLSSSSTAGPKPQEERRVSGADRHGLQVAIAWGWAAHHVSGAAHWPQNVDLVEA